MSYRRRRVTVVTSTGRRRVYRKRGRGPKHGSRYITGFFGRAFHTHWLFGGSRFPRKR